MGCLSLLAFGAVVGVISESTTTPDTSAPPPSMIDLSAAVRFTGTQFVVTNNDSFDWTTCELEVNPKTFSSGFKYHASILTAGDRFTVGALQFANGDGKRFNPFEFKPTSFSIACDTPRGRGFYYGGWE